VSGTKRIAPAGTIWVCAACGKTSRDRFGDKGSEWDESCMLNSVLCEETMRPNEKGEIVWHAVTGGSSGEPPPAKRAASESIYAATGSISDPTPAPGVKPKAL